MDLGCLSVPKACLFYPCAGKETYCIYPCAGKEAYCTDPCAGKEAYCTDPCTGKEAYYTDLCVGKGNYHGLTDLDAGREEERRYYPHEIGSGGEVKPTSITGNRSLADIR